MQIIHNLWILLLQTFHNYCKKKKLNCTNRRERTAFQIKNRLIAKTESPTTIAQNSLCIHTNEKTTKSKYRVDRRPRSPSFPEWTLLYHNFSNLSANSPRVTFADICTRNPVNNCNIILRSREGNSGYKG